MEEIKKIPVTAFFAAANLVVFLLVEFTGGGSADIEHMINCGAFFAPYVQNGRELYRFFTCMFLHFGMEHLLNNLLVLVVLGQRLEPVVGKVRFALIYLLGGVGANIISYYADKYSLTVSAGASGAVFALMGSMLYVVLRNKGRVQDLTMRQILIMAGFSLYFGFASEGVDNIAHLAGLCCGFLLTAVIYHPRRTINSVPS